MATCIFCDIVAGRLEATIVDETDDTLTFLDRSPVFPGHCLLVPREHHQSLPDLPARLIEPLFRDAQRLSRALPPALGGAGTFVAINNVVSQSVPHLHVHVVPRSRKDGLRGFFWPRQRYRDDRHREEVAQSIRTALAQGSHRDDHP